MTLHELIGGYCVGISIAESYQGEDRVHVLLTDCIIANVTDCTYACGKLAVAIIFRVGRWRQRLLVPAYQTTK